MSKEQTAKKERFLREVERQLLRKGLDSEMTEGGILNVKWHGQLLCDVDGDGVVCFPSKTVRGVDADASLQTVIQIASQVREYMPIFARAPALKAIGLEGSYKILADFGDAVLAGRLGKKGANFVTWEWDFDRNGVHMGHYFIEDYAGAKRDFAARSRLIEPQRLFSDKELGVIRNACEFALADDATLTYATKRGSAAYRSRSKFFCQEIRNRNRNSAPQWNRQCNISQKAGISFQKSRLFCVLGGERSL